MGGVHPTAIIEDGAVLGDGVTVGPGAFVGPKVRLGDGCTIHASAIVDGDTWLGRGCDVFPFAVLGARPQDKKMRNREAGDEFEPQLRIGEGNEIREHVTLHGGTPFGAGVTTIGDHNMFLAGSHVGHDATIGNEVVFTNGAMAAGHCRIEDYAILGAMVGVHQTTRVGTRAMVGAGSMLSQDAPPFSLVQGDRARLIGTNNVGLRRSGFSTEQTTRIKRVFRLLFWRDEILEVRLANARRHGDGDPIVERILEFVANSKRGVCMPRGRSTTGDETALLET